MKTQEYTDLLLQEIHKIFVGKDKQLRLMIMAFLSDGHILLDDFPGTGKTTLVKTMALALGLSESRIQFTPDLLPSDIIGTTIFNQSTNSFTFKKGPVHTQILLADEINRAIPRTQSALLEAMEEGQVTVDGTTMTLPEHFCVIATQNPVERESTFKLPAAQMDRFFLRISLGYPDEAEEISIISNLGTAIPYDRICPVGTIEDLHSVTDEISRVLVSEPVKTYLVRLVQHTRNHPGLLQGASPRASRALFRGIMTWAAMAGRDYCIPEDVQAIWSAVMEHRIVLTNEALYQKQTGADILSQILTDTPVPPEKEEFFHAAKAE
ncbi:MAG: MoxR family ATPase [Lachnospiraceae bacterium]|nr:MoxR family ATPase [Lachnospiraceae bacterium]